MGWKGKGGGESRGRKYIAWGGDGRGRLCVVKGVFVHKKGEGDNQQITKYYGGEGGHQRITYYAFNLKIIKYEKGNKMP